MFFLVYSVVILCLYKSKQCSEKASIYDDFRGITISPIISKAFELCVLNRFPSFFATSKNQFGFKKGTI